MKEFEIDTREWEDIDRLNALSKLKALGYKHQAINDDTYYQCVSISTHRDGSYIYYLHVGACGPVVTLEELMKMTKEDVI